MFFSSKNNAKSDTLHIAILGSGTTGIIQLLSCISILPDAKIDVIFDNNISIFGIGESSTPQLGDLISRTFNLSQNSVYNKFLGTPKLGVKWSGWGQYKNFMIPFLINRIGFHFDTTAFCNFFISILKNNPNIKFINRKVDQLNFSKNKIAIFEKQYDYVIDCSGGTKLDNTYASPGFKTVDRGLIYKRPKIGSWNYTVHLANENGWMFGIPLGERQTWGYLYNNQITCEDEALSKMKKYFPDEDIQIIKYEWEPRYSKFLVDKTKRYFRNGNKLFFFEPLHGLSNFYYTHFADKISFSILKGVNHNELNIEYQKMIDGLQDSMAFHYQHGSKYESVFWNQIVEKSKKWLHGNNYEKLLEKGDYNFSIGNLHALYDLGTIFCSFKNNLSKYYHCDVRYFEEEFGTSPEINL